MKTPYGNKKVSVSNKAYKYLGSGYITLAKEDLILKGKYSGLALVGPCINGSIPLYYDDNIILINTEGLESR